MEQQDFILALTFIDILLRLNFSLIWIEYETAKTDLVGGVRFIKSNMLLSVENPPL